MKQKSLSWLLLTVLMLSTLDAGAQQRVRSHRIGFLIGSSASLFSARIEAFRQRLRELGYVDGENSVFEYRYAEGKIERLPDLAADLVRRKVDVIVNAAGPAVLAAKNASATIPIVFVGADDPVGSGLVSGLARPGGNITGLSVMAPDLDGKRLELLREAFAKATPVAFLWEPGGTRGAPALTDMEAAAKALGLKLLSLDVRGLNDFDGAFARGEREHAKALITNSGPLLFAQQREILVFAAKNRLPAIYPYKEFVEAGGLMSYAPNIGNLWRRAADYVDKILKGAKPADIPVEQPTKFEFVINLKAATQLGVTIPPNVLARADKVYK